LRARGTEVLHKTVERCLIIRHVTGARASITIVVAGDGHDRCVVVLVRFVELYRVVGAHSVEIDDVPEMIEEEGLLGGLFVGSAVFDLLDHHRGKALLHFSAFNTAGIAYCMKDHCFCLRNFRINAGQDDVEWKVEVYVVSCRRRDERGAVSRW
jgi:hypothetical protein